MHLLESIPLLELQLISAILCLRSDSVTTTSKLFSSKGRLHFSACTINGILKLNARWQRSNVNLSYFTTLGVGVKCKVLYLRLSTNQLGVGTTSRCSYHDRQEVITLSDLINSTIKRRQNIAD